MLLPDLNILTQIILISVPQNIIMMMVKIRLSVWNITVPVLNTSMIRWEIGKLSGILIMMM